VDSLYRLRWKATVLFADDADVVVQLQGAPGAATLAAALVPKGAASLRKARLVSSAPEVLSGPSTTPTRERIQWSPEGVPKHLFFTVGMNHVHYVQIQSCQLIIETAYHSVPTSSCLSVHQHPRSLHATSCDLASRHPR